MIAPARSSPTKQIRPRGLEQFRQSIESWERQGQEAGRDRDVELAAGLAEDAFARFTRTYSLALLSGEDICL